MWTKAPKLNLAGLNPQALLDLALSRSDIQEPYVGAARAWWLRVLPWLFFPAFGMFCFLYGSFFALTAPYLIVQMAFPLGLLALFVIWALPDTRRAPTKSLEVIFFAFFMGLVLWPNYLALTLPGLPWITMARLTGFPATFLLMLCTSTSASFRKEMSQALNTVPWLWKLVVMFAVLQVLTIPLSKHIGGTLNQVVAAEINWTGMFFISAFVFLKPGRPERWAVLIWIMSLIVGGIGFWENVIHAVPWAGHIPAFLQIQDEVVGRILAGQQRSAIGVHRVQATFSTSLGLAEYLALTVPFVLHFVFGNYKIWVRGAAAATIPFLLYIVEVTDSRLGMVGFLLGSLTYMLLWSVIRWRTNKDSVFGPALTLAYPVIFTLAILSTFFVGRVRNAIWGNGAQHASNQGRIGQYEDGIPIILKAPWGHGMSEGGGILNHRNPIGELTIDTYYIAIGLDYGILGLIAFYGALFVAIYYGFKYAITNRSNDRDAALLTPLTVALTNFLVIKSVFSQQDNHPLYFMMLGMLVALVWRTNRERAAEKAASESTAMAQAWPSRPRRAG